MKVLTFLANTAFNYFNWILTGSAIAVGFVLTKKTSELIAKNKAKRKLKKDIID